MLAFAHITPSATPITMATVPLVPNLSVPKGNWVARNLRLVNDDSRELFPASAMGSRGARRDKYNSLYVKDYMDYPTEDYLEGLRTKGTQPKRETIRDVLFGNSPSEIFQDWNIPNRLVPEPVPDSRDAAAYAAVISGKRDSGSARGRQKSAAVFRTPRQHKLIHSPPPPSLGSRSATTIDGSELGTKDRLRATLQPHTVNAANDWLKSAPTTDKKVIQRVLQMQEKQHQMENAMRKSLQPNAKKQVENWLEDASDTERQVALKFFTSVAGAKLMGQSDSEQKGRLQQVVKALKNQRGQASTPAPAAMRRSLDSAMKPKDCSLKYVRLLEPQERKERWMHTTWHHLPEYKDADPVNNWSSHYVRPHAPTPRHFVIHPDWG